MCDRFCVTFGTPFNYSPRHEITFSFNRSVPIYSHLIHVCETELSLPTDALDMQHGVVTKSGSQPDR